MIPINDYQAKIYQALKTNMQCNVYDEVKEEATFPIGVISDYQLVEGVTKLGDYSFIQKFDLYSSYEGKKEINELVSMLIKAIKDINNTDINPSWCIVSTSLVDANVYRSDDNLYCANVNINITIERC